MTAHNLTAMVASRICHDLISPIGAISNGLELMTLAHGDTPEMGLMNDSVVAANSRIRLFRLAFGAAGNGQTIPVKDLRALLRDLGRGSRTEYLWQVDEDMPRDLVRCALLAMLCVEGALPQGGTIRVRREGETWQAEGEGPAMRADPLAFGVLTGESDGASVTPAGIQFLLLQPALAELGRRAATEEFCEKGLRISF